jgi:TonB family protein
MTKRKNDIERYLRGEMTPAEMHALEKEALQDPFLSEALEGIDQSGSENFLFDLNQLKSSVYQKTNRRKPRIISMWNLSLGIAASLLLLAVASIYIINAINQQQKSNALAMKETAPAEAPKNQADDANADSVHVAAEAKEQPEERETVRELKPAGNRPVQPPLENPNTAGPPVLDNERAQVEREAQSQPIQAEGNDLVFILKDSTVSETPAVVSASERKKQNVASRAEMRSGLAKPAARVIHGTVTSAEDGGALPGVNVLVKGTSIGTVTDAEGNYEIPLGDPGQNLVFGFIGMKTIEAAPGDTADLDVQLTPDYSQLSEVVVTGYGAAPRTNDNSAPLEFAEPQGGRQAFQQYLEEKLHYPEQALENKVEGRVTVQFTVGTNGQLEDFKIIKGLGFGCDDEVIRLIKEGPAWSPSKRNAQPVPEKVKVRLKFDIPDK